MEPGYEVHKASVTSESFVNHLQMLKKILSLSDGYSCFFLMKHSVVVTQVDEKYIK